MLDTVFAMLARMACLEINTLKKNNYFILFIFEQVAIVQGARGLPCLEFTRM